MFFYVMIRASDSEFETDLTLNISEMEEGVIVKP